MRQIPAISVGRYDFLASAIAQQKLAVEPAPDSQAPAFSDGESVFVTAGDDAALAVAVQGALVGAGSLDPAIMRELAGHRRLAERYLYCEVLRAAELCADRLPVSVSRRPELSAPPTSTALASLAHAKGPALLAPTPPWFGAIRPIHVLRKAVSREGLSALTGRHQDKQIATIAVRELGDEESGEESRILKLFQSQVPIRNPLSSLLNAILGVGLAKGARERADDMAAGGELPIGRIEQLFRRGIHALASRWPLSLGGPDLPDRQPRLTYAEWDVHKRQYRRDWVSVSEVDAWRADGEQDMRDIIQPPALELQRQLGSLGLDHELHRRQKDGADLDTGALIDCAIDLRTGQSPATINIYRANRKTRRDLAVAVIVDISGSTGEADGKGHSVFKRHLQIAYQLGHALDALGDTVAMFGFHSWGRQRARVVRLKGYEERWSAKIGQRIGLLEPVGYTRIGAAIRYGTDLLNARVRLPNRLLILITDGIAYDHDYERSYAEGDARKALEEAKRVGTACVCISVSSTTEVTKLQAVFGAANLLVVDDVEQVTSRIRQTCREALDRVSRNRSGAQVLARGS